MVALHWEKYFQHIREKYNKIYRVQMPLVTPHVCRHTFCSLAMLYGIPANIIQAIAGHSSAEMTAHYSRHVEVESMRSKLLQLPNVFSNPEADIIEVKILPERGKTKQALHALIDSMDESQLHTAFDALKVLKNGSN